MTTTKITITGKTWDEERVGEVEGPHAIARATFTTEWAGDIAGTSTCWLLIAYVDGDPDEPETLVGPYAGYELVDRDRSATAAARSCSAASGDHRGGVARTDVTHRGRIGHRGLAGISGSGSYAADAMEYTLELDYEL